MKRDNKDMKVLLESWRGYVSADAEVLTESIDEGMHGEKEKMEEAGIGGFIPQAVYEQGYEHTKRFRSTPAEAAATAKKHYGPSEVNIKAYKDGAADAIAGRPLNKDYEKSLREGEHDKKMEEGYGKPMMEEEGEERGAEPDAAMEDKVEALVDAIAAAIEEETGVAVEVEAEEEAGEEMADAEMDAEEGDMEAAEEDMADAEEDMADDMMEEAALEEIVAEVTNRVQKRLVKESLKRRLASKLR